MLKRGPKLSGPRSGSGGKSDQIPTSSGALDRKGAPRELAYPKLDVRAEQPVQMLEDVTVPATDPGVLGDIDDT